MWLVGFVFFFSDSVIVTKVSSCGRVDMYCAFDVFLFSFV